MAADIPGMPACCRRASRYRSKSETGRLPCARAAGPMAASAASATTRTLKVRTRLQNLTSVEVKVCYSACRTHKCRYETYAQAYAPWSETGGFLRPGAGVVADS